MTNLFIEIVYWTWCFPQTLIGALYFLNSKKNHVKIQKYKHAKVTTLNREHTGGFCLGKYIFIDKAPDKYTIKHEYGHTIQNFILGPLYIPVIWGKSKLLYLKFMKLLKENPEEFAKQRPNYFKQFPENWADKLGKVERK